MSRRSQSFRQGPLHTSKRSQSQNAVNTSISAHPLLPIETGLYYFRLYGFYSPYAFMASFMLWFVKALKLFSPNLVRRNIFLTILIKMINQLSFCKSFHSGMGGAQAEPRIEDAFSDEEGSGYGESPTRNSYPIQPSSGHGSTGGDLSDDDELGPTSPQRTIGFESLCLANGDYSPTQHQQQCARSRSGSCASRRSQLSQFRWVSLLSFAFTIIAYFLLVSYSKKIFKSMIVWIQFLSYLLCTNEFMSAPLRSEPPLCHYPQIYSSQQFIHPSLSTAPTLGGSQQFYGGDRGLFDQSREYCTTPGHFTPLHPGSINGSQCHISPL